jgi:hypothetical protein
MRIVLAETGRELDIRDTFTVKEYRYTVKQYDKRIAIN